DRFRRFKNLPPEERQRLLENYRKWRSLEPEKRKELRKDFERWRDLPPERRREEMKERFRGALPPHRPPSGMPKRQHPGPPVRGRP
ncbi:MAG: DUF3106 domain-containing protein, partial [Candidatus Brocadiales bacterium]